MKLIIRRHMKLIIGVAIGVILGSVCMNVNNKRIDNKRIDNIVVSIFKSSNPDSVFINRSEDEKSKIILRFLKKE